jgi:predicted nucleic acid-binding protein
MPYLADTNILLRVLRRGDPSNAIIKASLRALWQRREQVCYTPQNMVEFWRVCTRPAADNGFGLSVPETDARARLIERIFTLLPDGPDIHALWRQIVVDCAVSGVQVHDARLVAAMRVNGLTHILTLNTADFRRYPGIVPVHPRDIVAGRAV